MVFFKLSTIISIAFVVGCKKGKISNEEIAQLLYTPRVSVPIKHKNPKKIIIKPEATEKVQRLKAQARM